jgi:uroporphyrinogen-III synthase
MPVRDGPAVRDGAAIGTLAGFTIGVTADRRHDEQIELLERRGARVLHGPTIRTLPLGDDERLLAATRAVIAEPPAVAVFITALGVRSWLGAAESHGLGDELVDTLRHAHVVARGPKAVGALVTAGLDIGWTAPQATSNEVATHLRSQVAPGTRVVVQLDGERSEPFADLLRADCADLDLVFVRPYEWTLPTDLGPALRLVHAVADRTVDAVTFTSRPAVRNLLHIADDAGRGDAVRRSLADASVRAVCVGPVSAARAEAEGFDRVVQPRNGRLGAMVQAYVAAMADRGQELSLAGMPVRLQGRMVHVGGMEPVLLSERERGVLDALARKPGAVVSKQALLRSVWGSVETDEHVVEVTVARLRHRLGDAGLGVETVVRRGYRLAAE